MSVYIITYDLNDETVRPDILKAIRKGKWAKLSESSYAVVRNATPEAVYNTVRPYLDDNDNLYVITLTAPFYGWGPPKVNDWLSAEL